MVVSWLVAMETSQQLSLLLLLQLRAALYATCIDQYITRRQVRSARRSLGSSHPVNWLPVAIGERRKAVFIATNSTELNSTQLISFPDQCEE